MCSPGGCHHCSRWLEAIPLYEKSCKFDVAGNTAVNGWHPVNSSVRVVNNVGRYVVVNFNADAGVDSLAEIRLGYRVDAGPIQIPGAQNFANHTEYWQTRHSMVVLSVPAGTAPSGRTGGSAVPPARTASSRLAA